MSMPRTSDFENIERVLTEDLLHNDDEFDISGSLINDQVLATRKKIPGHTIAYKRAREQFVPPISKSRLSTARARVGKTIARNLG